MAHAIRARLHTRSRPRIEGFVAFTNKPFVLGAHSAGLLVSGIAGLLYPAVGAILCGLFTFSLWGETTGSFSWFRRLAPKASSVNLVVPGDLPGAVGTLVISTPLDAPSWRPDTPAWLKRPLKSVLAAAMVVTTLLTLSALAQPWGRPTQGMYVTALVVLAATVGLGVLIRRRTTGLDEDVSGPAVLIELLRTFEQDPLEHAEVWAVFTGCGHAYQNGMAAFLAMNRDRLPEPVLVLALDDPGRAPLQAVVSEGALMARPHRPTGPALVERMRWAGHDLPSIDLPAETDANAALHAGVRGLCIAGDPDARTEPANAAAAVETLVRIARLYDGDLARLHPDEANHEASVPAVEVRR